MKGEINIVLTNKSERFDGAAGLVLSMIKIGNFFGFFEKSS